MFVFARLKNNEMVKRVEDYIQCIVGVDYVELENVATEFRRSCQDGDSNFQASKLIQTKGSFYRDAWEGVYSQYYGVMQSPKKPTYISEYYIKRKRLIDDFYGSVKPGDKKYDEIVFAEYFYQIICQKLISLETLWCMEFGMNHDFVLLDEKDQTIYKYYRFFAQLFLQYTNDICKEYLGVAHNNENEIIDYQTDIDKTLTDFFDKKDNMKAKERK